MGSRSRKKLLDEYKGEMGKMQSGVMATHAYNATDGEPKHLRVGINAAMVNHDALVRLLIECGIINEYHYLTELVASAKREREGYEERLSKHYGSKVVLGEAGSIDTGNGESIFHRNL